MELLYSTIPDYILFKLVGYTLSVQYSNIRLQLIIYVEKQDNVHHLHWWYTNLHCMATHTILKLIYDTMTPACYKQKDTVRMESIVQYNTILQAANITFFANIFSIIVPESFLKAGSESKAESSSSPAVENSKVAFRNEPSSFSRAPPGKVGWLQEAQERREDAGGRQRQRSSILAGGRVNNLSK